LPPPFGRLYELQQNYLKYNKDSNVYQIAIVADADTDSKKGKEWQSVLMTGTLARRSTPKDESKTYSIVWEKTV